MVLIIVLTTLVHYVKFNLLSSNALMHYHTPHHLHIVSLNILIGSNRVASSRVQQLITIAQDSAQMGWARGKFTEAIQCNCCFIMYGIPSGTKILHINCNSHFWCQGQTYIGTVSLTCTRSLYRDMSITHPIVIVTPIRVRCMHWNSAQGHLHLVPCSYSGGSTHTSAQWSQQECQNAT